MKAKVTIEYEGPDQTIIFSLDNVNVNVSRGVSPVYDTQGNIIELDPDPLTEVNITGLIKKT